MERLARESSLLDDKILTMAGHDDGVVTFGDSLEEAYGVEAELSKRVFQSEDAKEGPKAFAEKRPPRWSGR